MCVISAKFHLNPFTRLSGLSLLRSAVKDYGFLPKRNASTWRPCSIKFHTWIELRSWITNLNNWHWFHSYREVPFFTNTLHMDTVSLCCCMLGCWPPVRGGGGGAEVRRMLELPDVRKHSIVRRERRSRGRKRRPHLPLRGGHGYGDVGSVCRVFGTVDRPSVESAFSFVAKICLELHFPGGKCPLDIMYGRMCADIIAAPKTLATFFSKLIFILSHRI